MEKPIDISTIENNLTVLGASPKDGGTVELMVCRPVNLERKVLAEGEFTVADGLIGDNWSTRGSRHTDDGNAHPGMQVAIMNSRTLAAIEPDRERWPLAGDQLFVDFDLSMDNLPVGQHIAIGEAVFEVSDVPHNGCAKFTERFGSDATRFVNSKEGRANRRRGINLKVIKGGTVRTGDTIKKIED